MGEFAVFLSGLAGVAVRLIDRVTSDEVIERAYKWVCDREACAKYLRHKHYHHNNDVWQLRRWWAEKKPQIVAQLREEIGFRNSGR